jgi:hypothetical protein
MAEGLIIKSGVSKFSSGINKTSGQSSLSKQQSVKVGKVMGVVTTNNTPTTKQFEKVSGYGGMGTVFFLDYSNSKNIDPFTTDLDNNFDKCDIAKPLFPNVSYYPLLGELVYIIEELPSPSTQINPFSTQKYYVTSINLWNDLQVNSQTNNAKASVGKTFIENKVIRNLLSYEGDNIIKGRSGNSIRLGRTVRVASNINEWSNVGLQTSPITIISNGHAYDPKKEYYLEQINQDASSIYLTTNQSIPLKNNIKDPINPLTLPLGISDYTNSQVILNADKIILNSKKDEIMLFADSNIEISTNQVINLNAGRYIHFNILEEAPTSLNLTSVSPKILLGTKFDLTPPTEPLLLGKQTSDFLLDFLKALDAYALSLISAANDPEGSPSSKMRASGDSLQTQLKPLYDRIQKLLSKHTFTI